VDENQLGEMVLGCALKVHRALGPGLLEGVYETCLAHELQKAGLAAKRQLAMPVTYDGLAIDGGYRVDLLIEDLVIVGSKPSNGSLTSTTLSS
jgi:GxxExxY protein